MENFTMPLRFTLENGLAAANQTSGYVLAFPPSDAGFKWKFISNK